MSRVFPARRGSVSLRSGAIVFLSFAALSWTAFAHPTIDARLVEVNAALKLEPSRGDLWLRRGDLYREGGEWSAARADYRRARELGVARTDLELAFGRLEFESGNPGPSLKRFDSALRSLAETSPRRIVTLRLRAQVLTRLGRANEALRDLDEVLELTDRVSPELLIQWADSAVAAGEVDRAVAGLDAVSQRFGGLVAVEARALEIEFEAGRIDGAVARATRLMASSPRPEVWAVRRAEILESSGRSTAALRAYRASRQALAEASRRRRTESFADLERRAESGLERLEANRTLR